MKLLLIDNRVRSIDYITRSLEEDVDYIIFDYETETVSGLTNQIPIKRYETIGIVQDQDNIPSYTLAKPMGDYDLNDYSTWTTYRELIAWCVTNIGTRFWDLIECNIDETWQPVITSLQTDFGITIRSSSKQLGNTTAGDNWLFDDGASLIGIYFTSAINDYPHTLGFSYNNIITFIDSDAKPWVRPDANNNNVVYGSLGLGNNLVNTSTNFFAIDLSNVTQVEQIYNGQVFLKSDGTCYSCGSSYPNTTGHGTTATIASSTTPQYNKPTIITFPTGTQPIKYITSSGYRSSFFLSTDSKLYVCGQNLNGELTTTTLNISILQKSLDNVYLVSSCFYSTLIVLTTDKTKIYLYGEDIVNSKNAIAPSPTSFTTTKEIKQIECGSVALYYVDVENNLYACGRNNVGQLGVGDTTNKTTWTKVNGPSNVLLNNVLKVSSAMYTLQIITLTGDLYLCGYYPWNTVTVGYGTTFDSTKHTSTPVKCEIGKKVVDVYSINDYSRSLTNCFFRPTDGIYGNLTSLTTYSTLTKDVDSTALTTTPYNPYTIQSSVTNPLTIYSNICFLEGTQVKCDQGLIEIEKINPDLHTISKKKIVAITQTYSTEKELVVLEKDTLRPNVPNQRTVITLEHKVFYKGKMIEASKVTKKRQKYNGELLYNVLMEEHNKMSVNNMIVETLDPSNTIGKVFKGIREYRP